MKVNESSVIYGGTECRATGRRPATGEAAESQDVCVAPWCELDTRWERTAGRANISSGYQGCF